jgi:hypothetical protein
MSAAPLTGIELRILYAVCFTLLGIVLATYVLPAIRWPDMETRLEVAP